MGFWTIIMERKNEDEVRGWQDGWLMCREFKAGNLTSAINRSSVADLAEQHCPKGESDEYNKAFVRGWKGMWETWYTEIT